MCPICASTSSPVKYVPSGPMLTPLRGDALSEASALAAASLARRYCSPTASRLRSAAAFTAARTWSGSRCGADSLACCSFSRSRRSRSEVPPPLLRALRRALAFLCWSAAASSSAPYTCAGQRHRGPQAVVHLGQGAFCWKAARRARTLGSGMTKTGCAASYGQYSIAVCDSL